MKLTTALIKDYIGNNILGKKLNLSNKHEIDLEEDPDGSVFKRDEIKFNNAKNWKRFYKAKVSECNSDRLSWSKYYTFTLPQSKKRKRLHNIRFKAKLSKFRLSRHFNITR